MVIKDKNGDNTIVKGEWVGFKKGEPPSTGKKMKQGTV